MGGVGGGYDDTLSRYARRLVGKEYINGVVGP